MLIKREATNIMPTKWSWWCPLSPPFLFSFEVFFSCIWVVVFPAPQLKTPPASHTKGAAEICATPKGRTKNPQIPSGPLIFHFSKILFRVHLQGLQFQPPPRWDLWGGCTSGGEMGRGWRGNKKNPPNPTFRIQPEAGLIYGNYQGVMSTSYVSKRTKIPHSKNCYSTGQTLPTAYSPNKGMCEKQFQGRLSNMFQLQRGLFMTLNPA